MLKILIVNFNTQDLTDCTIKSVNKHTPDCHIYVFDNSTETPYVNTFDNVTVLDNTKGQYIDFDEFLSRYPERHKSPGRINDAASAKHCYTIDRCMDIINDNFMLLDSDVIVKRDLHELVDDSCIFVGDVQLQPLSRQIKRVLPFVCYINVNMCKKYGVHYFDDNYMHGLANNKFNHDSDKYDTGGGFYEHAHKYKYKNIDHKYYVIHFKGGSWDDKATRSAGKFQSHEVFMEKFRTLWDTSYKKVVYTCISGPYDSLKDPYVIEPGFDYICFTDQEFDSNVWNIRPIPKDLKDLSQVKRQRRLKTCPHLYLPEYDMSLWVDSNVEIRSSITKYMQDHNINEKAGYLFVGEHPQRTCTYAEATECIRQKKDTPENINKQIEQYRKEGFPERFGLPQTCILFRYHNTDAAKSFGETWFNEIKNKSHRDQLSFSYVAWKLGKQGIVYLPKSIFDCPTFRWNKIHVFRKQTKPAAVTTTPPAKPQAKPAPPKTPATESNLTYKVRQILEERKNRRINPMSLT